MGWVVVPLTPFAPVHSGTGKPSIRHTSQGCCPLHTGFAAGLKDPAYAARETIVG